MLSGLFKVNSSDVVSETIDGETVIVSLARGTYYSLDQVGASVWNLIEAGATVEAIVDEILKKFDSDPSEMTSATKSLIAQLQAEQLIVVSNETAQPEVVPNTLEEVPVVKQKFVAPVLQKYSDMQDLLMLDPIHEVDKIEGWPAKKAEAAA